MPWYGWLGLVMALCATGGIAGYITLRKSVRGRAFLALSNREQLRFGRFLLKRGVVPWYARLPLVFLAGYLAMPFDIIPDFIPGLGQLDDLAVAAVTVALVLWLIPPAAFGAALDAARNDRGSQPALDE